MGNCEVEEWDFIIKERRVKTIVITVYNNIKVKKLREILDEVMEEKLEKGNLIIVGD